MERRSEGFGYALQLFYGDVLASTADGIEVGGASSLTRLPDVVHSCFFL